MADQVSHSGPLVPLTAQIEEIDRELKKRREVYPRWIDEGKITKKEAAYRESCLIAILLTLQEYGVMTGQRMDL